MNVLDTSGILRSDLDFSEGDYLVPESVLDEIKDEVTRTAIGIAIKNRKVKVINPDNECIKKVRGVVEKTGDFSLSDTDIDVLALALQKKCPIITDDYAIQNVASELGLEYEKVSQRGIKKRSHWIKICSGCGKIYSADSRVCYICGSKLIKKNMVP